MMVLYAFLILLLIIQFSLRSAFFCGFLLNFTIFSISYNETAKVSKWKSEIHIVKTKFCFFCLLTSHIHFLLYNRFYLQNLEYGVKTMQRFLTFYFVSDFKTFFWVTVSRSRGFGAQTLPTANQNAPFLFKWTNNFYYLLLSKEKIFFLLFTITSFLAIPRRYRLGFCNIRCNSIATIMTLRKSHLVFIILERLFSILLECKTLAFIIYMEYQWQWQYSSWLYCQGCQRVAWSWNTKPTRSIGFPKSLELYLITNYQIFLYM